MRRVFVEEIRFLVLLIIAEFFFPQNTAPARTRVLIPVEHAAEEQEHIHYLNAGSSISVPLDPAVGSAWTVTNATASCRYVDEMDAELSARFLSIISPSAKLEKVLGQGLLSLILKKYLNSGETTGEVVSERAERLHARAEEAGTPGKGAGERGVGKGHGTGRRRVEAGGGGA